MDRQNYARHFPRQSSKHPNPQNEIPIKIHPAVRLPIEIYSHQRIAEFAHAEAKLHAWFKKRTPIAKPEPLEQSN